MTSTYQTSREGANCCKDYPPSYELSPLMSDLPDALPDAEGHESFSNRQLPQIFERALDITFQGPIHLSREELKSLLVAKLTDCQKQVSSMYHKTQHAAEESANGVDLTTMSTPRASFNTFQSFQNDRAPTIDAFNAPGNSSIEPLPWMQMYEVTNATYNQLQYPHEGQTGFVDLWPARSRDSGYGTMSIGCVSNCTDFCTCYDSSEMNRNSFDGSAQTTNFLDGLGLVQGPQEEDLDSGTTQSSMLASIPRSNGNLDGPNQFLQLQ